MQNYTSIFLILSLLLSTPLICLPAQVMIIRHAEKTARTNELSIKGKERAAALVPYFLETPELIRFGRPAAIYTSLNRQPDSSQLAKDTVTALSESLHLPVRDKFESHEYKKMVDEIKNNPAYTGKLVIICWEHNHIPEIARSFGALQTPSTWSSNVYDRTWVITFQPSGKAIFQNLAQKLMFGDAST